MMTPNTVGSDGQVNKHPSEMNDGSQDHRPSLHEDARSRARERILEGALKAIAERGLNVTIDEVAEYAGVSRRTVFRYFNSYGELIGATLREGLRRLEAQYLEPLSTGVDIETWLSDFVVARHEFARRIVGLAFWDIHVSREDLSKEVAVELEIIAKARLTFGDRVAMNLWTAIGGLHEPPTWVVDETTLQISGFATNSFPNYSAKETGQLSARTLLAVFKVALEEQREAETIND